MPPSKLLTTIFFFTKFAYVFNRNLDIKEMLCNIHCITFTNTSADRQLSRVKNVVRAY